MPTESGMKRRIEIMCKQSDYNEVLYYFTDLGIPEDRGIILGKGIGEYTFEYGTSIRKLLIWMFGHSGVKKAIIFEYEVEDNAD